MTDPDSKIIANVRRALAGSANMSDAEIVAVIKAATTPVDPDEEWWEAQAWFHRAHMDARTGNDSKGVARCEIAGLRAAWPHIPLTKEALALLRSLARPARNQADLENARAFLARIEGDQK